MLGSSHLSREVFICLLYPLTAGYEAVMLFFILSGFVLSIPAINSQAQKYPVFIIRRIFRIYMPYLVALMLAVLGDMIFHGHITRGPWFNQSWSEPVNWRLVMQHIMFIGKYDSRQFDPPIWSLIYEMRISLVFPFLCAIVLWLRPLPSLILAAVMSCLSIFAMNLLFMFHIRTSLFDTLHYAALFIVGIYLARMKTIISKIFIHLSRSNRIVIAILSATLYIYGGYIWVKIISRFTSYDILRSADWFTALGAAGLIVLSLNSVSCHRILMWPPIHALGRMSYSVYLLHFIIMLLFVHLLYGKIPLLVIFTLCLVVVVASSCVCYRFVEIPFMNIGRRFSGHL